LVNVHIHQFQPGGAVVDTAALAQFQEQWATYRKLVESDCLAHREVSGILQKTLNDVFTSPFCFLDIACGDASTMKTALRGTQVRHYHGIDLSEAALDLAAANLAAANLAESSFEVELDHRDFVEAMMRRPEHADAAWCSLSIHHLSTDDKLRLMKAIRGATGACGIFLLYEPIRRVDEDRAGYLDRFMRTNKPLWRVLTPAEWDLWQHVNTCDFPETAAVWCELGREAASVRRGKSSSIQRISSGSSALMGETFADARRCQRGRTSSAWRVRRAGREGADVALPWRCEGRARLHEASWIENFKPDHLTTSLRAIPPAFLNPWLDCTICTQLRDCRKHLSHLGSAEECGLLRDVCGNCNTCRCDHPARK
jgi:hypothetical protein